MIALSDVTVSFPAASQRTKIILDKVSIDIRPGEWVALLGPNGSGKTTLLHTIAGLVSPSSGKVSYAARAGEGDSSEKTRPRGADGPYTSVRRPRIALLLQEPDNQFVTASVRHELELSLPAGSGARKAFDEPVRRAVERFGLGGVLERNPHALSGGEKQRLALATVWLQAPEVILLDEPTAYLDRGIARECTAFVRELRGDGVAVVWATPGGDELLEADRIVCLDGGRIKFSGHLGELGVWGRRSRFDFLLPRVHQLEADLREIAQDVGMEKNAPGQPERAKTDSENIDVLAGKLAAVLPAGGLRPFGGDTKSAVIPSGIPGIELSFDAVNFAYGEVSVFRDLDLTIRTGECLGVAGPNGAGKTTLLELASGVHEPVSGVLQRSRRGIVEGGRQNVFYLFQSPERMFFAETVMEEIAVGLKNLGVPRGELEGRAAGALERVGLDPGEFLWRAPLSLSLGEMRRVALAITLALEPRLVMLDEPTSCLDPAGRTVLKNTLARLRRGGSTVLVASHESAFLAEVCDRVVWLSRGKIGAAVSTGGGDMAQSEKWPEENPPAILALQDRLDALGFPILPRALTVERFKERLAGNRD